MNDTLNKIKAEAQRRRESEAMRRASSMDLAQRRSAAAMPLFKAFSDIEHAFVRIDVLKRIWPEDYQRRSDRARGLVAGFLGGEPHPYGLSLHIPGGKATFEVELTWDGKILYVSSREVSGLRPWVSKVEQPEPWLEDFCQTMATLLEL
ncbi:hypothetical protein [uncultured Thiodictyon sp.]|jgi:hypothetical protein|uniref:hypothetical protein n=1 Tax=uncultured Thiodictyon sp. TaxID=1846217 RepID=UPI0025E066A4|nr:hypothetical protein [uncultured Thiodictyon sp.]